MIPTPTLHDEQRALQGKRVLVVEDEGITQMHIRKILVTAGMQIVGSALSGPEGVRAALEHRPDLILMDINMPGEFNGLEASRRILSEFDVCIIVLTAYVEYVESAREIGACGYLVKPLDREALLREIGSAVKRFQKDD